mgnify:CR=1 FL=1
MLALTAQAKTEKKGVTKTNPYVNIMDFFTSQVLPELENKNIKEMPILKADCIKFVSMFRNQLPAQVAPDCCKCPLAVCVVIPLTL